MATKFIAEENNRICIDPFKADDGFGNEIRIPLFRYVQVEVMGWYDGRTIHEVGGGPGMDLKLDNVLLDFGY